MDLNKLLEQFKFKQEALDDTPKFDQYALEEAQRNYPALQDIEGNHGWQLVKSWIVEEVNKTIEQWLRGVDDKVQNRLSARVQALGWVLDLVDNKRQLYSTMLSSVKETEGVDLDGGQPFMDPFEDVND